MRTLAASLLVTYLIVGRAPPIPIVPFASEMASAAPPRGQRGWLIDDARPNTRRPLRAQGKEVRRDP